MVQSSSRAVLSIALLTALALGVRLVGIDFGLPLWEEADNSIPRHVELLRKGNTAQPRRVDSIDYPSLLARTASLLPKRQLEDPAAAPLEEHLAVAGATVVQVRSIVALLAVLVVPGTYVLARRFLGRAWSLFAAALLATSLLHLSFSQQARPHGAFPSALVWAVVAALWLRRSPSVRSYLAAGAAVALALGTLQTGALALLPLLAAHLLREGRARGERRLLRPGLLLAALPVAAAVPCFYSSMFSGELVGSGRVIHIDHRTLYIGTHDIRLAMFDFHSGFVDAVLVLWRWEPLLLALLALAAGAWIAARLRGVRSRRRADLAVLLAFVAPYVLLIGIYTRTYERLLLPLYPFLACAAAWGAWRVVSGRPQWARPALAAGLVLALGVQGYASSRLAWIRSRPDTCDQVGAWVRDNVEPGAEQVVITPPFDLPLARTERSLRRENGGLRTRSHSPWVKHQVRLGEGERPPPLYDIRWLVLGPTAGDIEEPAGMRTFLDGYGPGVYVLRVATGGRGSRFDPVLRSELSARGTLLARFSPDPDPYFSDHPLMDEDEEVGDWPHVFLRVLRARAVGPVLEVYRVP